MIALQITADEVVFAGAGFYCQGAPVVGGSDAVLFARASTPGMRRIDVLSCSFGGYSSWCVEQTTESSHWTECGGPSNLAAPH